MARRTLPSGFAAYIEDYGPQRLACLVFGPDDATRGQTLRICLRRSETPRELRQALLDAFPVVELIALYQRATQAARLYRQACEAAARARRANPDPEPLPEWPAYALQAQTEAA